MYLLEEPLAEAALEVVLRLLKSSHLHNKLVLHAFDLLVHALFHVVSDLGDQLFRFMVLLLSQQGLVCLILLVLYLVKDVCGKIPHSLVNFLNLLCNR